MFDISPPANDYPAFLASKRRMVQPCGFEPSGRFLTDLNPAFDGDFGWQGEIVRWALRRGRAGIFPDTGLGKTIMQLVIGEQVVNHTGGKFLLFAPLAVSRQTLLEARKFGIRVPVKVCSDQLGVEDGITITNYEKLHKFDPSAFVGVGLDECFAAGTKVDVVKSGGIVKKDIEDVQSGDLVINASGVDRVIATAKRKVDYVVCVKVRDCKEEIFCSSSHPWFTERGWTRASDLRPGTALLQTGEAVRMVQGSLPSATVPFRGIDKVLRSILLSEMEDATAATFGESPQRRGSEETRQSEIGVVQGGQSGSEKGIEANSGIEPSKRSDSQAEDFTDSQKEWAQAEATRRQRQGAYEVSEVALEAFRAGMEVRGLCVSRETAGWLSDTLQVGHRQSQIEISDRVRWEFAFCTQEERAGQKEGSEAGYSRVESVEILESTDSRLDRFRSADGSLYFYDLEAERHPSFSVNGCLVHNSSILKSFAGQTRSRLIEKFAQTPYRYCFTATPSPNDIMELGSYCEFLGIMTREEMLAMYFTHDGGNTSKWRLKRHAEKDFFRWMADWAVMIHTPADLGYDDSRFQLPPLHFHVHTVETKPQRGALFSLEDRTLSEKRATRRDTIAERIEILTSLTNDNDDTWSIWCQLNGESKAAAQAVTGAVEVTGTMPDWQKEQALISFTEGTAKRIVTKPAICGFGLNWQHCGNVVRLGIDDSYEQDYQVIRRQWRFGRTEPVHVHRIITDRDSRTVDSQKRKQEQHLKLSRGMIEAVSERTREEISGQKRERVEYRPQQKMEMPEWIT